jgi:hypothetical protein
MVPSGIWNSYDDIVLKGALHDNGMGWFKDILTKEDAQDIRAYVLQSAQQLYASKHGAPAKPKAPAPKKSLPMQHQ